MIWYALLIPIIVAFLGYLLYKHKIVWWELFLPLSAAFLFIIISYFTMKSITLSDVEYNGYIVKEARYYEPYETWVHKTCTYTTCSGSGKTRTCTTHTYDCSYCDYTPEKYVMLDSGDNITTVSEEKYKSLKKKWKATSKFVELNRDINYHGSCGKDGDMYSVHWNNKIDDSETTTYTKDFTNILKCNHSAFNYPVITDEEAKKQGLFSYPEIGDYNEQNSVLGLDSLNIANKKHLIARLNYLNGKLGYSHKVRVYTLFFKDKEIDKAFLQEAFWDGGNQNELVVCIGVDNKGNFKWVKPFSWADDKRMIVDTREDLMEIGKPDANKMYEVYKSNVLKFWHYKSFEDFNYLSFQPTTGQLIFVYLFTLIIAIGATVYAVKNDFQTE